MDCKRRTSLSSAREPAASDALNASRREFLRTASASAVMTVLGIAATGCGDSNPVDSGSPEEEEPSDNGITIDGDEVTLDLTADATQDLTSMGGFLLISEADVMAVNVDGTTIRAFTSTCTHQQCTIDSFSNDTFMCPCHGSQFDAGGEVVQGPAPDPLTEYDVARSDDTVTITK